MKPRTLILGSILLLIAGGSWWLAERSATIEVQYPHSNRSPDFFLENFTATTMDPLGRPFRTLQASKMQHYLDDDSTTLTNPLMTVYDEQNPPWLIRSERGWLSGDGKLILLQGEVFIDREQGTDVRPVHIVTRELRVKPEEDYAETDQEVHITSLNDQVDAIGMQAWMRPVRIHLLSKVKGRHEPQNL